MELRHLRYFVRVAEELNFTRAARQLFIAQPPLSQQIQQLEAEIGVKLFDRTHRRVSLTDAGRVFLPEAREILLSVELACESARRAARGEIGRLTIGFVATATYSLLPAVLRKFRLLFPAIELVLYELTAAEQAAALREDRIVVGFTRPYISDDDIEIEVVSQERYMIALPVNHPLSEMATIPLAELTSQPFILFPQSPKPSYADVVRLLCESAGFTPRIAQEVREMQTAISLISAGIGISIVPESVQYLNRTSVLYRPIKDEIPPTELFLAYRRHVVSPVRQAFLDVVRSECK